MGTWDKVTEGLPDEDEPRTGAHSAPARQPPARQRALLLCHRIPYPPDKGDKIRAWRLLGALAERYDVSLGAFVDDEDDWQHEDVLRARCASLCLRPARRRPGPLQAAGAALRGLPLSFATHRDEEMRAFVAAQRAGGLALEAAFSAQMLPYLGGASAPVIIDLADVDSEKWSAYAGAARPPLRWLYAREAQLLAEAERRATHRGRTFLVTPEEAAILRARPGVNADAVDYYRNGVDTDYFAPGVVPPAADAPEIVLTGAMDYAPNAEAARFLAEEILPLVRRARPAVTLGLVGARPGPRVQALGAQPGVLVTGRVPDIRPYLEGARVAVAPLAVARGVQNKVLEAMAMGVPVVASAGAATGTGAAPGEHLLVADGAEATAAAVLRVLSDDALAARLGAAGRAKVTRDDAWETTLRRLRAAFPPE